MAVNLDMNRGHISDIELGKREVGIITLQVIAQGFKHYDGNSVKGSLSARSNGSSHIKGKGKVGVG